MMNFRLLKSDLHADKFDALKSAECFRGVSRENPAGFIYSCRRISNLSSGENLNHGYKSETPVWITGCEYISDIYEEFYERYSSPEKEKQEKFSCLTDEKDKADK